MGKTVEDLKSLRAELIERRRKETYWIGGAHDDDRIGKVVTAHLAIQAIDAVIAEGEGEPETDISGFIA